MLNHWSPLARRAAADTFGAYLRQYEATLATQGRAVPPGLLSAAAATEAAERRGGRISSGQHESPKPSPIVTRTMVATVVASSAARHGSFSAPHESRGSGSATVASYGAPTHRPPAPAGIAPSSRTSVPALDPRVQIAVASAPPSSAAASHVSHPATTQMVAKGPGMTREVVSIEDIAGGMRGGAAGGGATGAVMSKVTVAAAGSVKSQAAPIVLEYPGASPQSEPPPLQSRPPPLQHVQDDSQSPSPAVVLEATRTRSSSDGDSSTGASRDSGGSSGSTQSRGASLGTVDSGPTPQAVVGQTDDRGAAAAYTGTAPLSPMHGEGDGGRKHATGSRHAPRHASDQRHAPPSLPFDSPAEFHLHSPSTDVALRQQSSQEGRGVMALPSRASASGSSARLAASKPPLVPDLTSLERRPAAAVVAAHPLIALHAAAKLRSGHSELALADSGSSPPPSPLSLQSEVACAVEDGVGVVKTLATSKLGFRRTDCAPSDGSSARSSASVTTRDLGEDAGTTCGDSELPS